MRTVTFCARVGDGMEAESDQDVIGDFENLVDELTKDEPNERQIQFLMEKLDLTYESDPVNRIAFVLEKMNKLIFESKGEKGEYDLQ